MGPASRFWVFPLYHQVEIRDAADVDYPQWGTGEELVLASAQCIGLATGPDLEGEVEIGGAGRRRPGGGAGRGHGV